MSSIHGLPIYPMNAGVGPRSYVQNSSYQRGALDVARPIIKEEIAKDLEINQVAANSALTIADFGCSTGHNSFPAMQIIIDAIKKKQEYSNNEFLVYFNDLVSNDFNTLFSSLPAQRDYHAVAAPGDFHRRLLPRSSIHFAYSSWSLHWLTRVPEAVASRDSPAWNGGRIWYGEAGKEVSDAYLEQFGKDFEAFLECRAVEIVGGGLMALLIPGFPASWNHEIEYTIPHSCNKLLESCLVDMVKKGNSVNEAEIDSFNIPYYFTTPEQLNAIVQRSPNFSVQRMEILNSPGKYTLQSVEARAAFYWAGHEGLLAHHFGSHIVDELFHLYLNKLAASPLFLDLNNDKSVMILLVLRRLLD